MFTDRKSRSYSGWDWNKRDVWLEDGDLLVLKGGILNKESSKIKQGKRQSWAKPNNIASNNNVFRPSQRIFVSDNKEVRRNDKSRTLSSFNDFQSTTTQVIPRNDRATSFKIGNSKHNSLWGLNVHCFIC